MREEMLEIHRDLTELGTSLKKQLSNPQQLIMAHMKSSTTPPYPNRNKRQNKLREKNQDSSSSSSVDSRWADQCNTGGEKPCDDNNTTMEVTSDEG
jgi:cation transport regulator ChaB